MNWSVGTKSQDVNPVISEELDFVRKYGGKNKVFPSHCNCLTFSLSISSCMNLVSMLSVIPYLDDILFRDDESSRVPLNSEKIPPSMGGFHVYRRAKVEREGLSPRIF